MPLIFGVVHEIGDIVDMIFHPNGPDTEPVYYVKARIVGYDDQTEKASFEVVGPEISGSLTAPAKLEG